MYKCLNVFVFVCIIYVSIPQLSILGLKPGLFIRVIQINWVTFCPGQAGLTWFIKYPSLTQILH